MEQLLVGLIKIILINIVLSGDNAVVIALACRNLPLHQQKKAIFFGSFGAIALRIMLTFVAVWLLKIPFVQVIGALLLVYIAVKLLKGGDEEHVQSGSTIWEAIKTIMIADFVMSLDNVLAVAGAANGNYSLIALGLAISIPLIVWGSQLLMKLMNKFPVIVWLGAGLLGYTAGEMIVGDKVVHSWMEELSEVVEHAIPFISAAAVIVAGKLLAIKAAKEQKTEIGSAHS